MKGTFEVIGYKNSKKSIRYYTVNLYNGVANDIFDKMKKMGYKNIDVRLI